MDAATALIIAMMAREGATDEQITAYVENAREADIDARVALENDDSEWADRRRGYGQTDGILRNEAGEYIGYM